MVICEIPTSLCWDVNYYELLPLLVGSYWPSPYPGGWFHKVPWSGDAGGCSDLSWNFGSSRRFSSGRRLLSAVPDVGLRFTTVVVTGIRNPQRFTQLEGQNVNKCSGLLWFIRACALDLAVKGSFKNTVDGQHKCQDIAPVGWRFHVQISSTSGKGFCSWPIAWKLLAWHCFTKCVIPNQSPHLFCIGFLEEEDWIAGLLRNVAAWWNFFFFMIWVWVKTPVSLVCHH